MGSECNTEEDESISDSIDDSSTEDDSDDGSISTKAIKYMWNGKHIHTDINTRYVRLKIRYHIIQKTSEWKISEFTENKTGKVLHKLFKPVIN